MKRRSFILAVIGVGAAALGVHRAVSTGGDALPVQPGPVAVPPSGGIDHRLACSHVRVFDGRTLAIHRPTSAIVALGDAADSPPVAIVTFGARAIAPGSDGRLLAATLDGRVVRIAADGTTTDETRVTGEGRAITALAELDGRLFAWDTARGELFDSAGGWSSGASRGIASLRELAAFDGRVFGADPVNSTVVELTEPGGTTAAAHHFADPPLGLHVEPTALWARTLRGRDHVCNRGVS